MTTGSNVYEQDAPQPELFSALLTPHRSLNRTVFLVLMIALCVISCVAGMVFLLMGAWPVFGFLGLDVLAIWWAFRLNFRSAKACEEITVTHSELRVRRTSHRGHGGMGAQSALGPARPQGRPGIRDRAALSGLPRPPGFG